MKKDENLFKVKLVFFVPYHESEAVSKSGLSRRFGGGQSVTSKLGLLTNAFKIHYGLIDCDALPTFFDHCSAILSLNFVVFSS